MDSRLAKLGSYKQIAGIAVAAVILTVIFVPFQKASAYTTDLTLPNVTDTSQVPTSAVGSTFKVTVKPAAGELVSVSQIEIILDNGQSSVKRTVFDSNGHRVSGDTTLTRGNIDITIPTPLTNGYGYGYGLASAGTTFSSPYSYAFSYSNAFISGNNVGYSNAVGTGVSGFVGDGTQEITIEGKLNTALMDAGAHTLDVLIDTGTGTSPDKIVAPQLSFTTVGNSSTFKISVPPGLNKQVEEDVSGVGKVKIKFANVGSGGDIAVTLPSVDDLKTLHGNSIFSNTDNPSPHFTEGGHTFAAVGDIFEIDTSGISFSGTITVEIPYDPSKLPGGFSEGDLKLLHFNTSTNTWEDITLSVDTANNVITGTLTSLSPVAVGVQVTTTSTTTPGTSTGGGGGGSTVDLTATYPDSYFVDFPLKKVQVQNAGVVDSQGQTVSTVNAGQQVSITSAFKNYQEHSQTFAYIVQVVNSDGFTVDLGWQQGSLASGQSTQLSRSWTAEDSGTYTIKIFIWNGVSAAPTALSGVTSSTLSVS